MTKMDRKAITTLGELRKSEYQSKGIKQELRDNLIYALQNGINPFEGIQGFDSTVIPDIQRAILSKHNILFLGLRGQAKTRIARQMVRLLDEYIPAVDGSEINDDPLHPISRSAKDLVEEKGDQTPITWVHRDERYVEKLATPDVSIADLIGDVDPIKAATLKLPYSDERVIHFGLVARSHRSIFVINELPDLQPRIQVSLFNILQEKDIQIRGFKLRLPLDIQFIFTANPEDYTNRGSIVTPLKDRIESQILTHYPREIAIAKAITRQEARISKAQAEKIELPEDIRDLLEEISFQARKSEYIDDKSGVSARMSISALENLLSTAERRMLLNNEENTIVRISDFWGVIPSMTGKLELVYEGEQEGAYNVALHLLGRAISSKFLELFPHPDTTDKEEEENDPFGVVRAWFAAGNTLDLFNDESDKDFLKKLNSVRGLDDLLIKFKLNGQSASFYKELVLHGLAELDILSKNLVESRIRFKDPLTSMFDEFNN